jgi:Zn-dependent protease
VQIDLATGLVWFLSFIFSTTVHEAKHALVAWKLGDPTAYNGGQVSLSPIPHVRREPIGMLVLPLLTAMTQGWAIGWASAPYDPHWANRYPNRAALMAAAGPAGNFLIAASAFVALRVGLGFGAFTAPNRVTFETIVAGASGEANFLTMLLSVLLIQNVFLGIFNLLPLPPLDGAAVFSALLPEPLASSVRQFGSNPMASTLGLLVAWQVFPAITGPIFTFLLKLVHPDAGYGPG